MNPQFNHLHPISKEPVDIELLSKNELIELSEIAKNSITSMDLQISEAKASFMRTGYRSNSDWYRRITTARKLQGRLVDAIQAKLNFIKEERREKTKKEQLQFESFFLQAAKSNLPKNIFDGLMKTASNNFEDYRSKGK